MGEQVLRNKFCGNKIILHNNHAEIVMYSRLGIETSRALVDLCDIDLIKNYTWYLMVCDKKHYAARHTRVNGKQKHVYMHRHLTSAKNGQLVDHKDDNGLDNRRNNLRVCTNSQNQQNRHNITGVSKYKGVSWSKKCNKWQVQIKNGPCRLWLGAFNAEAEAAVAYDKAALHYFGDYAKINFPEQREVPHG